MMDGKARPAAHPDTVECIVVSMIRLGIDDGGVDSWDTP